MEYKKAEGKWKVERQKTKQILQKYPVNISFFGPDTCYVMVVYTFLEAGCLSISKKPEHVKYHFGTSAAH